jgi:hypothetical protein
MRPTPVLPVRQIRRKGPTSSKKLQKGVDQLGLPSVIFYLL